MNQKGESNKTQKQKYMNFLVSLACDLKKEFAPP